MKCQYCTNELPPNVAICPSCGAQVQQPLTMPPPQSYQQPAPGMQYPTPPNIPMQQPNIAYNQMSLMAKSKTVYILLALLLGEFGIHSFYAGYRKRGVNQLLITVLTVGYCAWIPYIWGLVNAFSDKTDAKGILFK